MTIFFLKTNWGKAILPNVDSYQPIGKPTYCGLRTSPVTRTKKADVVEHPKAFDHVGLLFNEPPGKSGLHFISSLDCVTLYGIARKRQSPLLPSPTG